MRYNLMFLAHLESKACCTRVIAFPFAGRPPLRPMFKSRRLKKVFPGSPVFPSPQNQHFKIPIRPGMVDKEQLCGCATFFLFSKGWLVIHSPFVPASRYETTLHFQRILPKSGDTGLKRHQGLEIRRVQSRISDRLSRKVWINYLRYPYACPYGSCNLDLVVFKAA